MAYLPELDHALDVSPQGGRAGVDAISTRETATEGEAGPLTGDRRRPGMRGPDRRRAGGSLPRRRHRRRGGRLPRVRFGPALAGGSDRRHTRLREAEPVLVGPDRPAGGRRGRAGPHLLPRASARCITPSWGAAPTATTCAVAPPQSPNCDKAILMVSGFSSAWVKWPEEAIRYLTRHCWTVRCYGGCYDVGDPRPGQGGHLAERQRHGVGLCARPGDRARMRCGLLLPRRFRPDRRRQLRHLSAPALESELRTILKVPRRPVKTVRRDRRVGRRRSSADVLGCSGTADDQACWTALGRSRFLSATTRLRPRFLAA